MNIIYIDHEYKCHSKKTESLRSVETPFFDGKCETFIEGYRFVPDGEAWVRDNGEVFHGEMVSPWKPYEELEKAQVQYEHEQLELITADRDKCLEDLQKLVDEVLNLGGATDV